MFIKFRRKIMFFILFIVLSVIYFMLYHNAEIVEHRRYLDQNQFNSSYYLNQYKNYLATDFDKQKLNLNYSFFVKKSNEIGGYRDLPDTRLASCLSKAYRLPERASVSIIIVYYNEARSTLLRTLTSILQRSPQKYLKEIIIIDDFSDDVQQGNELNFLTLSLTSTSMQIIRNEKHIGLIESRNKGVSISTSDYIVFLDSHCEVNIGWMEPLLNRLQLFQGLAVSPVLDSIDGKTFQYKSSGSYFKGGFDWNLKFKWIPFLEEQRESRSNDGEPFASPVFSGGIFMVSRQWFLKLNGFNPLLKFWGGESIEMAIKLWLCGGQIEIVPCSRVGHIFKYRYHPTYDNLEAERKIYLENSKLIADNWLDEYKYFYYSSQPDARNYIIKINKSIKELKNRLQCKPFSWFLKVVFTEITYPNEEFIAFGKITSGVKCLTVDLVNKSTTEILMRSCYSDDITNWSLHRDSGKLSTESGACLNLNENKQVVLQYCKKKNTQRWSRYRGHLVHVRTNLCLENYFEDKIGAGICRIGISTQLFSFSVELQII